MLKKIAWLTVMAFLTFHVVSSVRAATLFNETCATGDLASNWTFDNTFFTHGTDSTAPSADKDVFLARADAFKSIPSAPFSFGHPDSPVPSPVYPITASYVIKVMSPAPSSWDHLRVCFRSDGSPTAVYAFNFDMQTSSLGGITALELLGGNNPLNQTTDISSLGLAAGDWIKISLTLTADEVFSGSIAKWDGSAYGTPVALGPYTTTKSNQLNGATGWRVYIEDSADSGVTGSNEIDSVTVTDSASTGSPTPTPTATPTATATPTTTPQPRTSATMFNETCAAGDAASNWTFDNTFFTHGTDSTAPSTDKDVFLAPADAFKSIPSAPFSFGNPDSTVPAPVYPVTASYVIKVTSPAPSSWDHLRFGLRSDGSPTAVYAFNFDMQTSSLGGITVLEILGGNVPLNQTTDISSLGLATGDWVKISLTLAADEALSGSIAKWNGSAYGTPVALGPYTTTKSNQLDGNTGWRAYIEDSANGGVSVTNEIDSVTVTDSWQPTVPVSLSHYGLDFE